VRDQSWTHSAASEFAEQLNKATKHCRGLKAVESMEPAPRLQYLSCWVLQFRKEGLATECAVLVEEILQTRGKYIKHNSNNGTIAISRGPTASPTMTIAFNNSTVFYSDFLQAFSHWKWFHHKKPVCDIQGILDQERRYPMFVLTDPAICTTDDESKKLYGCTNTGIKGIRIF
jgi:hypothetical protein